jgi:hypothetical protein
VEIPLRFIGGPKTSLAKTPFNRLTALRKVECQEHQEIFCPVFNLFFRHPAVSNKQSLVFNVFC